MATTANKPTDDATRYAPRGQERAVMTARLPEDLKAWLDERAEKNGRTSNAELEHILGRVRARDGR